MANVALDGMGAGYQGTYASKILLEPMFLEMLLKCNLLNNSLLAL